MAKIKDKNIRVDPVFAESMGEIAKIRLQKGLAALKKEEIGTREMTRLLLKTDGWKQSIEELKTKPKKENLI